MVSESLPGSVPDGVCWRNDRWLVGRPDPAETAAHLAIIDADPDQPIDATAARLLLAAYHRARSALWATRDSRGFQLSFSINWTPDAAGVGEPHPVGGRTRVIHVFGRSPTESTSPTRVMAQPRHERHRPAPEHDGAELALALTRTSDVRVDAPVDRDCDGCARDVLTTQERWREDGVRVIRPHAPIVDAQAIVLPVRHVVSVADLTADEIVSMAARLTELLHQFSLTSASTGLSCFLNDGTYARQETPHVHLHVYGRSRTEAVNPFEILAQRLGSTAPRQINPTVAD